MLERFPVPENKPSDDIDRISKTNHELAQLLLNLGKKIKGGSKSDSEPHGPILDPATRKAKSAGMNLIKTSGE